MMWPPPPCNLIEMSKNRKRETKTQKYKNLVEAALMQWFALYYISWCCIRSCV